MTNLKSVAAMLIVLLSVSLPVSLRRIIRSIQSRLLLTRVPAQAAAIARLATSSIPL